jgi:hypothetical protein
MTLAEYEELPSNEKEHFFECPECGQFVDKRELRDVIFHVTGHKQKAEIPRIKGKAFLELERVTRKAEKPIAATPLPWLISISLDEYAAIRTRNSVPPKRLSRDCSVATAAHGHSLCNYRLRPHLF